MALINITFFNLLKDVHNIKISSTERFTDLGKLNLPMVV